MLYSLLADLVVAVHVAYVSFVVLGQLAIVCGVWRGWGWVRNPWFRIAHLVAIGIVVSESHAGTPCPLTVWENELRGLAGQEVSEGTFIGRGLHSLIFYDFPPWVFTSAYTAFGLVVVATLIWAPPRWRRSTPPSQERAGGLDVTGDRSHHQYTSAGES